MTDISTSGAPARVTWGQVLAIREFRAMVLSDGLSVLGDQVARIAVALLVYSRTGSAFAASATYACSFLVWLVGGPVLSVYADRYPRRELMIACDVVRAPLVALLAVPHLPLAAIFVVLALVGVLSPPFESARSALLPDILAGDRYLVGNAITNTVAQTGQVLGFLLGGVLVATIGTSGALAMDALTFAVSAWVLITMVSSRPAPVDPQGESRGVLSDTREGFSYVTREPHLRALLCMALLGAACLIGPEGLAVAVTAELDGGPLAAGVLTAAVPLGFVLGSAAVLRVQVERRLRLLPLLLVIGSAPLIATPFIHGLSMTTLLWIAAGLGSALQLIANAAFVQAVPAHLRGRAFGLAGTSIMAVQGLALLVAGLAAEHVGARRAVGSAGAAALLLVLFVTRMSYRAEAPAQGVPDFARRPQG